MKAKYRIKIMQETSKAKIIRSFTKEEDDEISYNTRLKQKEIDKKINFLKGLCKLL